MNKVQALSLLTESLHIFAQAALILGEMYVSGNTPGVAQVNAPDSNCCVLALGL